MHARGLPAPQDSRHQSSSESELDAELREDSEGWDDIEPDVESIEVKDFFSDARFSTASAMLAHCKGLHGFDFVQIQKTLGLDFLECVKLVNFVRDHASKAQGIPEVKTKDLFASDQYLQPVLEDDALLFSLDEILEPGPEGGNGGTDGTGADDDDHDVVTLRQRLAELEARFADYRAEVAHTLDKRWEERPTSETTRKGARTDDEIEAEYDKGYFDAYSYNEIHQIMLKDSVRTDAYRDFIYGNKHLFKDKVVLDVGCGTGILSMFCAKAGARKVIAVDNSAIIEKTKHIILINGLQSIIECVRGKIEDVSLPAGIDKVDIIVSEWMGYGLLFEAMLDSVLYARDKYLAPDGLMVPSHCTLHLGLLADPEYTAENYSFWQDVYGFDMTPMMDKIYDDVVVRSPDASSLAGRTQARQPFLVLDLHSTNPVELDFRVPFKLVCDDRVAALDGFCVWFDTIFATSRRKTPDEDMLRGDGRKRKALEGDAFFSTGPFYKTTHWQTVLCMVDASNKEDSGLDKDALVEGTIAYTKDKDEKRALNIRITWQIPGADKPCKQEWRLR